MRNIAIIPARSGSKGLPDKNIKELCGKPLLAYSIEAAFESGMFDRVHVSTDSEQYAEIARRYGADVRFLRGAETSSDTASTWAAMLEVLEKYEQLGERFDTFTILQPTVPLRIAEDIRAAYRVMEEKNANTVVSVCECEHAPILSNYLKKDMCMAGFLDPSRSRRQDYQGAYRLNGAVYILKTQDFMERKIISYDEHCFAAVMPAERSVDIDTEFDFAIARAVMQWNLQA